jgi:hypothetical protein
MELRPQEALVAPHPLTPDHVRGRLLPLRHAPFENLRVLDRTGSPSSCVPPPAGPRRTGARGEAKGSTELRSVLSQSIPRLSDDFIQQPALGQTLVFGKRAG